MRFWLTIIALLAAFSTTAAAKPLEPGLQQQLLGLYDNFNRAIAAGKPREAIAMETKATGEQLLKQMPTAAAEKRLAEELKSMTPDTVAPLHGTINAAGDKATIITTATKTIPKGVKVLGGAPPGTVMRSEITVTFVKENGAWKIDEQSFGPDPTQIKRCDDTRNEPDSAFKSNSTTSLGGPITRVDFQSDHTIIVIRVLDEENCILLRSNKDQMRSRGLDPDTLAPYVIVEVEGAAHKTSKRKVLATKLTIRPDE